METWQIILAIIIVGLSIIMPIYYSYKRKNEKRKLEQELKEGREVSEREKIRVYVDSINDKFRNKHKWKKFNECGSNLNVFLYNIKG